MFLLKYILVKVKEMSDEIHDLFCFLPPSPSKLSRVIEEQVSASDVSIAMKVRRVNHVKTKKTYYNNRLTLHSFLQNESLEMNQPLKRNHSKRGEVKQRPLTRS